jgi:hypothetical protein
MSTFSVGFFTDLAKNSNSGPDTPTPTREENELPAYPDIPPDQCREVTEKDMGAMVEDST